MTAIDLLTDQCHEFDIEATSAPHCVEAYKDGFIFSSKSQELTYCWVKEGKPCANKISIKSKGLGTNLSLKPSGDDFYLFNEYGLHYYEESTKKTYSQNCFDITNCGISLNKDGSLFTVADFGGSVYTFTTEQTNIVPVPLSQVNMGIPVRTIVWCHDSNKILIGCVGGTLFCWDGFSEECNLVNQLNHTINILRYFDGYVFMGTSDGFVHVLHSETITEIYSFQAHFPIHY